MLESRNGIEERRAVGYGSVVWDSFWKILSILVIPWASAVMWLLFNMSNSLTEIKAQYEDVERRLRVIEAQMDPAKRFYRWDGQALEKRIEELEELHPRTGDL
jgi:hypothetical protein